MSRSISPALAAAARSSTTGTTSGVSTASTECGGGSDGGVAMTGTPPAETVGGSGCSGGGGSRRSNVLIQEAMEMLAKEPAGAANVGGERGGRRGRNSQDQRGAVARCWLEEKGEENSLEEPHGTEQQHQQQHQHHHQQQQQQQQQQQPQHGDRRLVSGSTGVGMFGGASPVYEEVAGGSVGREGPKPVSGSGSGSGSECSGRHLSWKNSQKGGKRDGGAVGWQSAAAW